MMRKMLQTQKFILTWCQCTNVIYKRKSYRTMWGLRCINLGENLLLLEQFQLLLHCKVWHTATLVCLLWNVSHHCFANNCLIYEWSTYLFLTHLLSSNSSLKVQNVYVPFCGRFELNPTFNRHLSDTVRWRLDFATGARFLSLKTEISEHRPFRNALEKPTV